MDEPSPWEQVFLVNLQVPAAEWERRRRRVKSMGWLVGGCVLATLLLSLLATGGRVDLVFLALVAVTGGCLLLLRNVHRWMGVMLGAVEREERRQT